MIDNSVQLKKNKTFMCKYVKYVHLDLLKNSQENTTGLRRTLNFYQNCIKIVEIYYNSLDVNESPLARNQEILHVGQLIYHFLGSACDIPFSD